MEGWVPLILAKANQFGFLKYNQLHRDHTILIVTSMKLELNFGVVPEIPNYNKISDIAIIFHDGFEHDDFELGEHVNL